MKGIRRIHAELGISRNYAKERCLSRQREALRLVSIGPTVDGRPIHLTRPAARAWLRMQASAADDGITLVPISGFRSIRRQADIVRAKLKGGQPIGDILRVVAAPGYSEHHTGHAIDLGCPGERPLEERFAKSSAFRWLKRHAARFGFHLSYPRGNSNGIVYEPWHWRWMRSSVRSSGRNCLRR